MQIIPVIDLKDGRVVHARQGQRDQYQPIHSKLCPDSEPLSVIDRYLSLYPFKIFYIADLNAIQQQGDHNLIITQILHHHPQKTFWIDQGELVPLSSDKHTNSKITVIGSESINPQTWSTFCQRKQPFILSLDFSYNKRLGLQSVFDRSEFWPQSIIIMTLNRVGSQQGPDIQRLQHYQEKYPEKNFIAAGGIRNKNDLQILNNIDIKTALIASALHQGTLDSQTLVQLCNQS